MFNDSHEVVNANFKYKKLISQINITPPIFGQILRNPEKPEVLEDQTKILDNIYYGGFYNFHMFIIIIVLSVPKYECILMW